MRALVDDGVSYVQIDAPRYSYYMDPEVARLDPHRDGAGPGRGARRGDPRGQRLPRGRAPARRDAGHPSLPRQQPEPLVRRGRLRPHRREALHVPPGGPVPPRVRRRALRDVRAAAIRATRQDGRARPGLEQAAASSRPPPSSAGASRPRRATSPWTTWRSRRSAASPRRWRAISSPRPTSGPSSAWS